MNTGVHMSNQALQLAIRFHETYERLAPSFGYETRADTKTFDPESKNGRLMVAVCAALTQQGVGEAAPVAWWIPKAEQFALAKKDGSRPFAKAWEPLYATAQPEQKAPAEPGHVAALMEARAVLRSLSFKDRAVTSALDAIHRALEQEGEA